jgi:hypothetical protein
LTGYAAAKADGRGVIRASFQLLSEIRPGSICGRFPSTVPALQQHFGRNTV